MNTILKLAVIFGVLGLVAGYLLFGRVGGNFISPMELIAPSSDFFSRIGRGLRGVEEIRTRVLLSGGIGAVAGVVVAFTRK